MFDLIDDVPRLEQASHWEVTKHHLQAAKHNISSDSLTPSGEDGHSPMVTIGEDGEVDQDEDGEDGEVDVPFLYWDNMLPYHYHTLSQ